MSQVFNAQDASVSSGVSDGRTQPQGKSSQTTGMADPFGAPPTKAKAPTEPLSLWVFDAQKAEPATETHRFPTEELATIESYIAHIVHKHHAYTRSAINTLTPLVAHVAEAKGHHYPEFKALNTLFTQFKQDVLTHLCQEESVIFPACVAMETQGAVPAVFQGRFKNPLSMMQSDHGATADMLGQLHHLLATVVEAEDACETYHAMRNGLWQFLDDLNIHLYKEDQILFPRIWTLREQLL